MPIAPYLPPNHWIVQASCGAQPEIPVIFEDCALVCRFGPNLLVTDFKISVWMGLRGELGLLFLARPAGQSVLIPAGRPARRV